MSLYNTFQFIFLLLNPHPHVSYLSYLGSFSMPPQSIGLYSSGRNLELGLGPMIYFGRFGEMVDTGSGIGFFSNYALSPRYTIGAHFNSQSKDKTYVGYYGFSIGRYNVIREFNFRTRLTASHMYYYEFQDRYTYTNLNLEGLIPFRKWELFMPYVALQLEWGWATFPDNISEENLSGLSPKLGTGISFRYRWFNSCFSFLANRGNLNFVLSASVVLGV